MKIEIPDTSKDYRKTIHHWTVDNDGDLIFDGWYIISKARLAERDWISHISEKTWCDFNDFIPAYFKACEMAGIKQLTVNLYNWNDSYKFEKEK